MIIDKRLEFCDATALNTGAAGTYLLGNQVDLSVVRDVGVGDSLYLVIAATTGITTAGSAGTVSFVLASDDSASISTTTSTRHATSAAWVTGSTAIAAGTVLFAIELPMQGTVYERYLGILQITGTTALNAGAIDAFLTNDVSAWKPYADAVP